MKKFNSIIVCFILIFGVFCCAPNSTFAQEIGSEEYTYKIQNGKAIITEVDKNISGEIIIPPTLDGYPVTRIDDYAFYNCPSITSVTIPNSINSVGDYAFWKCYSLNSVHITDISNWCDIDFENGLSNPLYHAKNLYLNDKLITDLAIPKSVTKINDWTFYKCKPLETVTIKSGVKEIGKGAFWSCTSLQDIKIPKSITKIGSFAFRNCKKLKSIKIPSKVFKIKEDTFMYCKRLSSVRIGKNVKRIERRAFFGCKQINSIKIGENVKTIEHLAFYNCKRLKSLTISKSVKTIGSEAFENCDKLKKVTIPRNVKNIYTRAFGYKCLEDGIGDSYYRKQPNFTIKGKQNSSAQKYAKRHKFKFVVI